VAGAAPRGGGGRSHASARRGATDRRRPHARCRRPSSIRARLIRLLLVNRDIFIRTALLIGAMGLFCRAGRTLGRFRAGGELGTAQSHVLVGAFFVDGFALAASNCCGHATGARQRRRILARGEMSLIWGFGFGAATTLPLSLARRG